MEPRGGRSCLFQPGKGIRLCIAADLANLKLRGGGQEYDTYVTFFSLLPNLNFNLGPNRHSIGFGYAYGLLHRVTGNATDPDDKNAHAFVVEGRDFFRVGKEKNLFISVKAFIWMPNASIYSFLTGLGTIGFEF